MDLVNNNIQQSNQNNDYQNILALLQPLLAQNEVQGNKTQGINPNIHTSPPLAVTTKDLNSKSSVNTIIKDLFTALLSIDQYAKTQREEDKAAGKGLIEGAKDIAKQTGTLIAEKKNEDYSKKINTLLSSLVQEGVKSQDSLFENDLSFLDNLGKASESYILGNFAKEGGTYLSEALGIEVAKDATTAASTVVTANTATIAANSVVTAESATAATANAATTEVAGTGVLSSFQKIAGPVAALYSAYGLINNFGDSNPVTGALQGATVGAYLGSVLTPVGSLVGGAIGGVIGGIIGLFKKHKHKDQVARDEMRSSLKSIGFLDSKSNVTLADGNKYDLSKDGGSKLTNIDQTKRRAYEVDFKNPLSAQTIGWLQPLTSVLVGRNQKLYNDLTGYLTNAAISNASDLNTAKSNVIAFYKQAGIPINQIANGILAMRKENLINDQVMGAYINGLKTLLV